MRGLINIHAPNIFIPSDVHKRHLNADRELVELLRTSRFMTLFVNGWTRAYQAISRGDVKHLIKKPVSRWRTCQDLNVCYDDTIDQLVKRKRGISWPSNIHLPTVASARKDAERRKAIRFLVNRAEFRELCSRYDIEARWSDKAGPRELSVAIKDDLLAP